MDFDDRLGQAWGRHGNDAEGVARDLSALIPYVESDAHVAALAQIGTHVWGEHLGRWNEGLDFLARLRLHAALLRGGDSERALERLRRSLSLSAGREELGEDLPQADALRVLLTSASALVSRDPARAQAYFKRALEAAPGLAKEDPAHKTLATTANNIAYALETQDGRNEAETELMLLAARAARTHWEIAGGWLEVERAEYRLAKSYLKAGLAQKSREHAQACLRIVAVQRADALEVFYAHEALALAELSLGNRDPAQRSLATARASFAALGEEDRNWVRPDLDLLVAVFAKNGIHP